MGYWLDRRRHINHGKSMAGIDIKHAINFKINLLMKRAKNVRTSVFDITERRSAIKALRLLKRSLKARGLM